MYNNGFPVTYPQITWPYQQQAVQSMTPPTIHADIVQVADENEAWNYQVAAGDSKMMMARDDSAIFIKSAFPNSPPTLDVYLRQDKQIRKDGYVTREELMAAIAELSSNKSKTAEKQQKGAEA